MTKVALLIGVSDYEPGLAPLPSAMHDVDAMQRVLQHPDMGGFAATEITVLKNPLRQDMERALYRLFADRKKDDLVLLFFSGHGIKDENGKLYLATRETCKDNGRLVKPTAVSAGYVHEIMTESRSRREVIILDCCFSGAFAFGMTAKDDGAVAIAAQLGGEGRAILTSSTSTQYSFERHGLDLSIYTHYLVEGIEQGAADQDDDGFISVDELHDYASSKVREAAPAMTPEFYPTKEGHKILLAKSAIDDPLVQYRKVVYELAKEDEGEFSVINRSALDELRSTLDLSAATAAEIETQALVPYRIRREKVQRYQQVLAAALQRQYPLSDRDQKALARLQRILSLEDRDLALMQEQLLAAVVPAPTLVEPDPTPAPMPAPDIPASSERHEEAPSLPEATDYSRLQALLQAGDWHEADEETSIVMLRVVGREHDGWLDSAAIAHFPCQELQAIDQLWAQHSNGRFGFRVQGHIFRRANYNWEQFSEQVGWLGKRKGLFQRGDRAYKVYAELNFSLDAPSGHFPVMVMWEWKEYLMKRIVACQLESAPSLALPPRSPSRA